MGSERNQDHFSEKYHYFSVSYDSFREKKRGGEGVTMADLLSTKLKGSDNLRALFLARNPRATRGSGDLFCG